MSSDFLLVRESQYCEKSREGTSCVDLVDISNNPNVNECDDNGDEDIYQKFRAMHISPPKVSRIKLMAKSKKWKMSVLKVHYILSYQIIKDTNYWER